MVRKLAFYVWLSILCLTLTNCVITPKRPDPPASDFSLDPIKLSCNEYNDHIDDVGVTVTYPDGQTETRPGRVGSTRDQEEVEVSYPLPTKTTKTIQRIYCNCNQTYYEDATTCTNECRATLGCFTGICEPRDPIEQVCLKTTVKLNFSANQAMFRADWQPPGGFPNDACREHVRQYYQRVEEHERQHYAITEKAVRDANEQWRNGQQLEACGNTEAEANERLKAEIDEFVDAALDAVKRSVRERNKAFHEESEPAGRIDCNICGS